MSGRFPIHVASAVCALSLVGAGVTTVSAATATAARTASSSVVVSNFNNTTNDNTYATLSSSYSDTAEPTAASHAQIFNGKDSNGDDASTTFNGLASATADFGVLKATARGTVINGYYNPSNPAYYDPDTGVNPDGMPDAYAVFGQAEFTDVLQHGGTAHNYNSRYQMTLTGSIEGDGFVVVDVTHGNASWDKTYQVQGDYSIPIVSDYFVVGSGNETFSLRLMASFQLYLHEWDSVGHDYYGSADFGSTLTLDRIELSDPDTGATLGASDVSFASGASYPVGAIPEPSMLGLVALGVLPMLRRRAAVPAD